MLHLYQTLDMNNVINKRLVEKIVYSIKLKKDTNIYQPVLLLQIDELFDTIEVNYAYIDEFDRYYFISDIETVGESLFNFYLECDVLETYKEDILSGTGLLKQPIKEGIYSPVSTLNDVRKQIDIHENTDGGLTEGTTLILSTIGG